MPFAATWMGLEVIIPNEVSQRNVPNNVTCMQNLKYNTNELIYKAETDSQTQRMNLWLPEGKGVGRNSQGVWEWHIHNTVFKMYNQQRPTLQHRDLYSISCNNP